MNSGSVLAIVVVQSGLVSNGSVDCRHANAWSIAGGKVACALPGGMPVLPLS